MNTKMVVVKECADGDLFIELPENILKELDWNSGDMLTWILNDDGTVTINRQYRKDPEQPDIFQ